MGFKQRLVKRVLHVVAIGTIATALIGGAVYTGDVLGKMLGDVLLAPYQLILSEREEHQEYLKEQIAFNQQTISEQKAYTERLKEISQSVVEIERSKAFQESIKPENGVAAEDVTGNTLNHYSLADLIKNSSYFVSYPEPVTVDTSCLEAQVSAYSRGDIGVAPRFGNQGNRVSNLGNLTGFDVWAKRAGAGYTRMDQDLLQRGISCQYVQPVEAPTP